MWDTDISIRDWNKRVEMCLMYIEGTEKVVTTEMPS